VLGAGAALVIDLAGKADTTPPAAASRSPTSTRPPSAEPDRPPMPAAPGRTIYGSLDDLDECAHTARAMGAASRAPGSRDDIPGIARRLERIRKLEFESRVSTRLLPRDDVGARFVRGFRRDFTAAEADRQARVFEALGLVPEALDLREAAARLFRAGVAGFYDRRSERLFAAATEGGLSAFDEVVLAHELDHALVDQTLGLPRTTSGEPLLGDEMLAHQALAEGDATLAMSRYAWARLGAEATAAFLTRFSGAPVTPPEDVPYVLLRTSEFPYFEGLLLACTVWRRGGWAAVDELYERPPSSTAEVLFPALLRTRADPADAPPPGDPGPRWNRLWSGSLGAFDVMLLLENADVIATGSTRPGSHAGAVRGWAGGRLTAWARRPRTAVHLGLVDAGVATGSRTRRRLCAALRGWVAGPPPDAAARLACRGSSVELALGPSGRLVRHLLRR
jgi:hypothetical protein